MTHFFQMAKTEIDRFPANIVAATKLDPNRVGNDLQVRLSQQKRSWAEVISSGQRFVIDAEAMSMLHDLGLEYWLKKSPEDDHQLVLPFPKIILECPYSDGTGSRLYFVRQRGEFIDFAPMAVTNDHWKAPCSVRAWNTETDEDETFFTAVYDLRGMTERRELLGMYEAEDDMASAFAKLVTIGLCLHLDDPRYLQTARQPGTHTRQQRRQAERKGQPLPAFSIIRIKLTEEGARKHQEMQAETLQTGAVRQPPRRHHVRAHTVRRRNGTTYQRRAFVRGHGDLIEQTRIVEMEDDAEV